MKKVGYPEVAIVVPAFNEELIVEQTLQKLLSIQSKKHVVVVDDGSSDKTAKKAKKYSNKVLSLKNNVGKANALNRAIAHYRLTKKYRYIMPIDADSTINKDFLEFVLKSFAINKKAVAVVGKVVGYPHNWVSAYRCWEYEIGQEIHKRAQSYANMVSVCPGPSTVYKSEIFNKIKYSSDTKTEDMDLTFALHRKKWGRIVYQPKAVVRTQDPKSLKAYLKQIDRWYTGFWQCVLKHNIPWQGQRIDVEVALLALEGLFNGVLVISFLFFLPLVINFGVSVFLIPLAIDLFAFVLPSLVFTSVKYKTAAFFKYILHFYLLRYLTGIVFLKSFFKVVFLFDRRLGWNKVERYILNTNGK